MSDQTNPISFRQIFDFTDATGVVKPAIDAMSELSLTSKQFFDIVTNGNLDKLTTEIAEIKGQLADYAKTLQSVNLQTKEGQQTVLQAVGTTQSYREQLDALNASKQKGTNLSKEGQAATDNLNNTIAKQIEYLRQLELAEIKNEDAIAKQTARINQNVKALEELTGSIKGSTAATAGNEAELKQLQIILEKIITTTAKLNVAQTDENKTLVDKTVLLQATNRELKLQSIINDEKTGEYAKMVAQSKLLNIQYANAVAVSSEYAQSIKNELNATDLWIKQNSAKSAVQRLTIGDYKNAREELTLTIERMRELLILQQQEGAEYQQLRTRAVQLTIANKQVTDSIKEQVTAVQIAEGKQVAAIDKTTIAYKLQQFVVRDLFRLVAGFFTIIPIMAGIELITETIKNLIKELQQLTLWERTASDYLNVLIKAQNSAAESAGEEKAKMETLYAVATNLNIAYKDRELAVKKLQELYPDYFGNLKLEDILAGKAADSYNKLTDAIERSAKAKGIENTLAVVETKLIEKKDRLDKLLGRSPDQLSGKDQTFYEPNKNEVAELQNQIEYLQSKRKTLLDSIDVPDQADRKTKKGPKGKDPLTAALADEKRYHEDVNELQKKSFEFSNKSFNDYKDLYQEDDDEAQRHYDKQLAIIKKYGKISGESADQLRAKREEAKKELDQENAKNLEARNRDIAAMHEYEERKILLIEDTNRKIKAANDQSNKVISEAQAQAGKDKNAHKDNSYINLIGAFLGTGGESKEQAFKADIARRNIDIETSRGNRQQTGTSGLNVASRVLALQLKVDENNRIPDTDKTPTQLKDSQRDLEEYKKAVEEKKSIDEKYGEDNKKYNADLAGKQAAIDLHAKEQKIYVAEQAAQAIQKVANSAFDLQKKRIAQQMSDTQALASFEMTLAGNNSAAKLRISEAEQKKMRQLKREEAKLEKEEGVFNVIVSTAEGIAKAWSYGPIVGVVLSGIIAAMGLIQVANITSAPLPAYYKGRIGGQAEFAKVNERGPELIERQGKYLMAGEGKEAITYLQAGDTVHTHEKSMKILSAKKQADNWMDNLLSSTGAHRQIEQDKNDRMIAAMSEKALTRGDMDYMAAKIASAIPEPKLVMPASGVVGRFERMQNKHLSPK